MLSSIHPLGERGRHNRFWVTAAFYAAGSALGGMTIGATAGSLGRLVDVAVEVDPTVVNGLLVLAVAAASVAEWRGTPLPALHRQVDEDWLGRYRGWVYGTGFGFQLGSGVLTHIATAAVHTMILAAVLSGTVAGGAIVGGTFGTLRGLTLLAAARVTSPSALVVLHQRIHRWAGPVRRTSAVSLLVVSAGGAGTLLP